MSKGALSRRARKIKPSPTLSIDAKAKAMKSAGVDIINFGVGEPDFDTPGYIKKAAVKAIQDGFTKYTPVGGIVELKDAVIKRLKDDHGLSYSRQEIVISCGGKHALYNLAQALFDKGDEVIIPAPYWVSYPPIVELAGAKPVIIETREEDGFDLDVSALEKMITPRTKAIILNSPSNPTGSVFSTKTLRQMGNLVQNHNCYVISDDIYEKIRFDGKKPVNLLSLNPKLKEKVFILNGVSKTYAMTGWRIGYLAGPADIISALTNIQSQSTSNPTSIAQKAAVAALNGPDSFITKMVSVFKERRDYIVKRLKAIPDVTCVKPQGAFYAFPNVSAYYFRGYKGRKITNSIALCDYLLEEARLAVVPGVAFGDDRHIRFSFATSMENIAKGMDRFKEALKKLS
ncbi:MAG: pyridoxal phosphate-dependent aminotransferase [Deltaproteobacteria bacterium]|nr:pyridoxal phosphate-dependent aminotransferase [Deltaproteobacteria bacterium]